MNPGSVRRALLLCLFCAVLVASCATRPQRIPSSALGSEIADNAISLLGRAYRYGGADPAGFDCSGLVRYVHHEVGIETPRTAAEQFRTARPVSLSELVAGDLLFFKIDGGSVSHVAIYVGEGRFIHAPRSGRPVETRSLDDAYYRPRLVGAGRLF
jgi:murein DD-endopeptidase